jgi:protein SCO1/2
MLHTQIGARPRMAFVLLSALGFVGVASGTDADPEFRDEWGRAIQFDEFRGHPVVATMAYATCRRACPATVATLKQLERMVAAEGRTVEFVIVGYDPQNDDPRAWRDYRANHGIKGEHWQFLTGTEASTLRFSRRFGFPFWRVDEHVMHKQRLVVLDEKGHLVGSDDQLSLAHLRALLQKAEDPGHASTAITEVAGT